MAVKKQEGSILEILNSNKFDNGAFMELRGFFFHCDAKGNIEAVADMLQKQYMDVDIENIFINNDKDEIIDFLNRLIHSKLAYKNGYQNRCDAITLEELEEFKMLAAQTDKISKEELSKTAPLLTTRTYLEMCRIVYDATFEWKYPRDISTAYLFCEARMLSFKHEYSEGILGIDWDLPEQFARRFGNSYHNEELRFGGPELYIQDESACMGKNIYTLPNMYRQWTGYICCNSDHIESLHQAIKMYIALCRKGYPVYYQEYSEAYLAALKTLRQLK